MQEYNNRWEKPLVNPPVTQEDLDKSKQEDRVELLERFEAFIEARGL